MLAIDLGGTRVKVGRVRDGRVEEILVAEHGGHGLSAALSCCEQLAAKLELISGESARMCVPGLVSASGQVLALPGKLEGAIGADLPGWLSGLTGGARRDSRVINDAIAYGLGEAGELPGRSVVMTIGTGIGTAVIENGEPLGSGELGGGVLGGQLPLTAEGPIDTSGRAGTIEAWCRAERVRASVAAAGYPARDVAAACAAARDGEAAAVAGVAAYQAWLARGIAALCLAYGPDRIILGGGPIRDDGLLLDGLDELVEPLLWAGQRVEIRKALHGDAAALIGLWRLSEESP